MNNRFIAGFIAASVAISYLLLIFLPLPYLAILAAVPLSVIGWKKSLPLGFLIGFVSALSLYLIYPVPDVMKLSAIIAGIVSLPAVIITIAFPLFYGLIFAFSGMLWSEVAFNISSGKSPVNEE